LNDSFLANHPSAVLQLNGLSDEAKTHAQKFRTLQADRDHLRKQKNSLVKAKSIKENKMKVFDVALRNVKCKKTRACILNRSRMQTAEIQEGFERILKEVGKGINAATLPVYCVSATKFLDLEDGKPPALGFPRKSDTQIPQLRKGLVATTLKKRHENAKAALEEIASLNHSLRAWVLNINSIYQVNSMERERLENAIDKNITDLLRVSSQ
jgi:hypothetical protein